MSTSTWCSRRNSNFSAANATSRIRPGVPLSECSSNCRLVGRALRDGPWAVSIIVVANVLVFVRELDGATQDARVRFVDGLGLVPYDITHGVQLAAPAAPTLATLLTSQFLHASVVHLAVNMLFLAAFGPRVEWLYGHAKFLVFYLVCGTLGGLAQVSAGPGSHVPGIGASGAIAGVLGAYVVRFPTATIGAVRIPAALFIGIWAAVQLIGGFAPVAPEALAERGGGVAYFAHIGGFLSGVLLAGFFAKSHR